MTNHLDPTGAAATLGTPGFGVDNLPYASYVPAAGGDRRLGVRLGDSVLPVRDLLGLVSADVAVVEAASGPNLDALIATSRPVWDAVRAAVQEAVTAPEHAGAVLALATGLEDVVLSMPFTVADYVDFYGNEFHATNVGRIFRPHMEPLTPNWKHLPIGYHGRAGTIVVSGTDFPRPQGVLATTDGPPVYAPSKRLDIEAEVGFVLGSPVVGGRVDLAEAEEHIFGLTLTNDWSARDIQAFEYVPLGPNLGKSFCTSISAWVTPLAAFSAARVQPPVRDVALSSYLDDSDAAPWCFDIEIEVVLNGEVVSVAPFAETYWTAAQMLAHMTVNGAGLRAGDFFAGGTVSGPGRLQRGCFLEITWGGTEPLVLADGQEFTFLRDGDEVVLRATAAAPRGGRIQLGECTGRVLSPVT